MLLGVGFGYYSDDVITVLEVRGYVLNVVDIEWSFDKFYGLFEGRVNLF